MLLIFLVSLQSIYLFALFLYHTLPALKHIKKISSYQVILTILLYISLFSALVHYFIVADSGDARTWGAYILNVSLKNLYIILDCLKELLLKSILILMTLGWKVLYLLPQLRFVRNYLIVYLVLFTSLQLIHELIPSGIFTFARDLLDLVIILWMNVRLRNTYLQIQRLKKPEPVRVMYSRLIRLMIMYFILKCVEILVSIVWRQVVQNGDDATEENSWLLSNASGVEFFRFLTEVPFLFILSALVMLWHPTEESILLNFTQDLNLDGVLDSNGTTGDQFELFDADDNLLDDDDGLDIEIDSEVNRVQSRNLMERTSGGSDDDV